MSFFSCKLVMLIMCMCFCSCVNIAGIDRVLLVQKLYENARPLGMGYLHPLCSTDISYEKAKDLVGKYIDYYNGRVMKIRVPAEGDGDEINTRLYNRDNGEERAEEVVEEIRRMNLMSDQ